MLGDVAVGNQSERDGRWAVGSFVFQRHFREAVTFQIVVTEYSEVLPWNGDDALPAGRKNRGMGVA